MNSSEKEKMLQIMKANSLHAYLATCDGGQPMVRPVSPVIEEEGTVWITTFCSSRKVKQINENSRICLAFVEYPRGERAATVIGDAGLVDSAAEKRRIWGLAQFDLSEHFPSGPESKEFCLLKITVRRVEWRESWTGGTKVYEPEKGCGDSIPCHDPE